MGSLATTAPRGYGLIVIGGQSHTDKLHAGMCQWRGRYFGYCQPCYPRRQLEQQRQQPPRGLPQQQHGGESQQQHRISLRQDHVPAGVRFGAHLLEAPEPRVQVLWEPRGRAFPWSNPKCRGPVHGPNALTVPTASAAGPRWSSRRCVLEDTSGRPRALANQASFPAARVPVEPAPAWCHVAREQAMLEGVPARPLAP